MYTCSTCPGLNEMLSNSQDCMVALVASGVLRDQLSWLLLNAHSLPGLNT